MNHRHNHELTLLAHIAQALNRTVAIDEALQLILRESAQYFQLETGWIWLLPPDDGEHYLAAALNLPPALRDEPLLMTGWCYCIDDFREDATPIADQIKTVHCSRLRKLKDGHGDLHFHASIPLIANGQKLGLLNLASAERPVLTQDELDLLYTIGGMLAIAVERNRLTEQSREAGVLAERNRLAREIHDTLAQGLTGIGLLLESAELLIPTDPDRAVDMIRHAVALTQGNLEEARRSVLDLRASPLENKTLPDAIRDLANHYPFTIEVNSINANAPVSTHVAMGLYRIAQEAIANIAQHANATHAIITLIQQPQLVTLCVQDNGSGFDVERIGRTRFGLLGMTERAKLLHGTLSIESTIGSGTMIWAKIPT
jgi:two-component system NarL family sensor kinase